MERKSIKRSQAKVINTALFPGLNYLCRLRNRMIKVGFLPDVPLFLLVSEAYDAVYRLHMETHYLSCNGVGRRALCRSGPASYRACSLVPFQTDRIAGPKMAEPAPGAAVFSLLPAAFMHVDGQRT